MINVLNSEQTHFSNEVNWKGRSFVKFIRLECYEEALNNLTVQ
jgi:adenine-specific DNA-methyltransferase